MIVVEFRGKTPLGACCKQAYLDPSLDRCIDTMNLLVRGGWLLEQVRLYELGRQPIDLPIDAFDGQPITDEFRSLAAQWQAALEL